MQIRTPENDWIDEIVWLRSKAYSIKCRDDVKNNLKGISISQTKHIKIEEYEKCLDEKE